MLTEMTAAFQSAKMIREFISASNSLSNKMELLAAVTEIQEKLFESQQQQMSFFKQLQTLEQEIKDIKHWKIEADRYALTELSPGVFVYRVREEMRGSEPIHMLCANCFQSSKKSILQCKYETSHGKVYVCHSCNAEIVIRINVSKIPQIVEAIIDNTHWML